MSSDPVVVTGALSYTGKYVTRLMLNRGLQIRTLTNHPEAGGPVKSREDAAGESRSCAPFIAFFAMSGWSES